jgi:hypothetical protein
MNEFKGMAIAGAIALSTGLVCGCSTTAKPGTTEARIPAAQNYDVRIQPARIPPNPQGAFALSSATGCDVIYIAKAAAADTVTYAVRPTSRVPDASQCSERLAQQPGVEGVNALR